jgi:hypothetical protein
MVPASRDFDQNVFLNCPFDNAYKPLFDAAVFAVQIAGFTPHCALEASNAGQARLEKMFRRYRAFRKDLPDFCRRERLSPVQLTFGDFSSLLFVWLAEKEN